MSYLKNPLLLTIARNLALKGIGIPAAFGCLIILANLLGTEAFGSYSLLISTIAVVCAAVIKLISVVLVREISQAQKIARYDYVSGIVSACLLLIVFVAVAVFFFSEKLISINLISPTFLASLVLITLLSTAIGATLRGLGSVELGLMTEQILRPVFQLILLFALFIFNKYTTMITVEFAILTYALSISLASLMGLYLLIQKWPKPTTFVKPSFKSSWFQKSGPALLMLGLMGGINSQLPVLLLGSWSSTDEISLYRVGTGVSSLIGVVLIAVNMATGPILAKIAVIGDMKIYETKLRYACTIASTLAIFASTIFIAFASPLVNILFNQEYAPAASFLWVCCITQALNCICGPVVLAFNMLNRESSNIAAIILAVLAGVLSGFALIPTWGAYGAALSALISMATWNVYLVILLKLKFNVLCLPYSPMALYAMQKNR